ncbi:hypothetical protein RB195_015385 [Necator americanus]|uniref:Uncharacterized protein n=1 Tax=Necator americanus TaxID=51031 RepID=A0ABR1E4C6_NECAM
MNGGKNQRVVTSVVVGTRKKEDDANSFTKSIQDKENIPAFNIEEEVLLCICRDNIQLQFCLFRPHYLRAYLGEAPEKGVAYPAKRDRASKLAPRAKRFEKDGKIGIRRKPILHNCSVAASWVDRSESPSKNQLYSSGEEISTPC